MDTTDNSRKSGAVEEDLKLIRLWSEGMPIDEIGALFGRRADNGFGVAIDFPRYASASPAKN